MQDTNGIVISGLSKRYPSRDIYALKDLSLSVAPGEVYGFLGPNGAGKSTTIRMLMNFIQPTEGNATVLGLDCVKNAVAIKQSIGYLSGDFAVYPKMTGEQYLRYMDELQGGGNLTYAKELAKKFDANLKMPLGELSRGNRQKVGIIQAFMHRPKVFILDEPSSGLDPLMQEVFYSLIAEMKANGSCVFMSSHIMSEVQKTCDRVGIIREGKLIAEHRIADLSLQAAQTFDIGFAAKAPLTELRKIKGVKISSHDDTQVTLHMQGNLSDLLKVIAKYDVVKLDTRSLDLEEMFMHFYEKGSK